VGACVLRKIVFRIYNVYILGGNYLEFEGPILYLLTGRTKIKRRVYSLASNCGYTTKIGGKGCIYRESHDSSRREGYI